MEPAQARPVKKRRRWLIVALILAGLVIATRLLWPSEIDPRFIGTWRVGVTPYVWRLGADGKFTYMRDGAQVGWTQWRVRGGTFYNLYDYTGWAMVRGWMERVRTGRARDDSQLEVVSVTPDEIVMREFRSRGEFTLIRVPDGFVPPKREQGIPIFDDYGNEILRVGRGWSGKSWTEVEIDDDGEKPVLETLPAIDARKGDKE